MAASISFTGFADDAANRTSYTFSGQSFGDAAADRLIAVVALSRASGTRTMAGVTIGGVSATRVAEVRNSSEGNSSISSIWLAAVPTGSSGSVVVTFFSEMVWCGIAVYRIVGSTGVVADVQTSTLNAQSVALDIPAGGVALAGSYNQGNATATWTGLVKDFENVTNDGGNWRGMSSASAAFATAQNDLSVACNWSNVNIPAFAAASFEPVPARAATKMMHYRRLRI